MTPHLTDADVASLLQVPVRDVQALARAGTLRGFKVGRRWRFTQDAVNAFIGQASPAPRVETPSVAGLHPSSARRIRRRAVV